MATFSGGEGEEGGIGMDAMGFLMDMPLRDVLSFQENARPISADEIVDGLLTQVHGQA
jgi:hypothetical protein